MNPCAPGNRSAEFGHDCGGRGESTRIWAINWPAAPRRAAVSYTGVPKPHVPGQLLSSSLRSARIWRIWSKAQT